MATKKSQKTTKKESKFYVAKTVAQAREKIEAKVKDVNENYVKKQFESGREFFTELKSDPVKRIDDLIDDSKDALKKEKESRMESLQNKLDARKKDARKKMDTVNQKSREVYKGLENDAKLIFNDVIEMGKKNIDKLPMKKTIEKKISAGIDSIPSKLNLPSKEEIDNLVAGVDGVNKKVDALNRDFARA